MRLPALLTSFIRGVPLSVTLVLLALTCSAHAAKEASSPITEAAAEAMWWGDFAAVEKQNAYYNQPNRFEPDGYSQLDLFHEGLANVFKNSVENTEEYLKEMDKLTLQWATENPKSALAHVLHARALVEHGWSYRGGGYVKDVPPDAWKDFHAYLRRAVDYLNVHSEVALTDTYAHLVLLQAGRGLDFSNEQMIAIANDGLKRNPDNLSLYFDTMGSMLPKWGGDARILDNYIKYATEQTRAKYGLGMYAWLYWSAAENQFGHALFETSFANWDKMKQGFEDMAVRYPNSPRRVNRYAHMACIAKDRDTLLRLLKDLEGKIEVKQWGANPERSLESCRRWATET
jgi:hypothetical protein